MSKKDKTAEKKEVANKKREKYKNGNVDRQKDLKTERLSDRERDRKTDRETDRETELWRDRQRDKETEIQ
jgi:hypothetical protein